MMERAIPYWEKAGARAFMRSANREAIAHFQNGLELLEAIPARASYVDQELRLLLGLGPALMTTRSSAAPEIGGVYARARHLAQELGQSAELFPTVWGSWLFAFMSGNLSTANGLLDELFSLARSHDDSALMLQAHHAAWPTLLATGDLAAAEGQIASALALYHRETHSSHAQRYGGHDPAACGYANGAMLRITLGYPDQAVQQIDQALSLARSLAHPPTLSQSLWFAADLHYVRREPQKVEHFVAAALPLLTEHGSAVSVANATMLRGWAFTDQGEVEKGIADLREGLGAWRSTASQYQVPYRLARAADAYRIAGHAREGLSLIAEAVTAVERTGDRWFEADLHRLGGELLLLAGENALSAATWFQRALVTARQHGARLLELRASTSLARLWRDQSKRTEAHDLLAPIYGWFTEGFDTPDLKEAKALLEELAA
jgi:predicted ATPase